MLSANDVLLASKTLEGVAIKTPIVSSESINEAVSGRVHFKLENLQRGGAFKFRGAYVAISRHLEAARRFGVITASSGNHGTALALAARLLGVRSVVIVPTDASQVKLGLIRAAGAEMEACGTSSDERLSRAAARSQSEGLVMIPPYDHPDVMAGQATVAAEALEQVPDLDYFLAPCGGGGLLAGCAGYLSLARPEVQVYGVEAETANDTYLSFQRRERVKTTLSNTIADGMRNLTPGSQTFPIVLSAARGILLVDDDAILRAMRKIMEELRVIAEPTGAAAPAAIFERKLDLKGKTAVVVISGGNVEAHLLLKALNS